MEKDEVFIEKVPNLKLFSIALKSSIPSVFSSFPWPNFENFF